jgi:outer membrane lipoprotein-sorting protein
MNKIIKLIALIMCLLVSLVILAGCGKSTTTTTESKTTTTTVLTAAQIITKASESLDTVNSFHFALNQVGGGTPIGSGIEMTKVEGDIVKPDRLKATISGTVSGMSLQIQMVSVGDVTYMTNPLTGNFEVLPVQFEVLNIFDPNNGITAIMKGIVSLSRLNDEQSGGVACYHISSIVDSQKLSSITGGAVQGVSISVELWIGQQDFLARSIKLTGKITETEVPGIVRTLDLSMFNQPITVELPK